MIQKLLPTVATLALGALGVLHAQQPLPTSFISCIQVAYSYCPLSPGTYYVTQQNQLQTLNPANGVYIAGTGTSPFSTVLMRPNGMLGNMMYVGYGNDVTIYNLTFNGNRYSFANAQTGCGPRSLSEKYPSRPHVVPPEHFDHKMLWTDRVILE